MEIKPGYKDHRYLVAKIAKAGRVALVGLLNWVGRIILYLILRMMLYQFTEWDTQTIRIATYSIAFLWLYNEFPSWQRALRTFLKQKPYKNDEKDDWRELKDFAILFVIVAIIVFGREMSENAFGATGAKTESSLAHILVGLSQILEGAGVPFLLLRYAWAILLGKEFWPNVTKVADNEN